MNQLSLARVRALQTESTAEAYAHPRFERYGATDVDEHWYKDYQTR